MAIDQLHARLAPLGLRPLGQFADDGTCVLIGPDEPRFWPIFAQSAEFSDGQPDPLDRWSRRVLDQIAADVGGTARYPFGGPPYAPFYTWALQSGQAWPSPIGFLVHETAGLFVSFRGAIHLPQPAPATPATPQPCATCSQPCATACPVGAFDDGYDVTACKAHVTSPAGVACRTTGCLARAACPVGQGTRLPEQAAFHMAAFL